MDAIRYGERRKIVTSSASEGDPRWRKIVEKKNIEEHKNSRSKRQEQKHQCIK